MTWPEYEGIVLNEWNKARRSKNEAAIHAFFEHHPCMLPGAYGLLGPSGHPPFPGAIISQPLLTGLGQRRPDFMWIATDSGHVYPVMIEIETPIKRWFTRSGMQTHDLTQALGQIADWEAWFARPQNAAQFIDFYRFPSNFRRGRTLRPLYALIYGSSGEFAENVVLSEKRGHLRHERIFWMTFDRPIPDYNSSRFSQ